MATKVSLSSRAAPSISVPSKTSPVKRLPHHAAHAAHAVHGAHAAPATAVLPLLQSPSSILKSISKSGTNDDSSDKKILDRARELLMSGSWSQSTTWKLPEQLNTHQIARVLQARTAQLILSDPPLVEIIMDRDYDMVEVARDELRRQQLNFQIRRWEIDGTESFIDLTSPSVRCP